MDLQVAVRHQAAACAELGSPMYADLLGRIGADIDHHGLFRDVLAGHEEDAGPSALALRLLGSIHRLVLDGRAPALADFYPSVGGRWQPEAGWRCFVETVRDKVDAVRSRLPRPPQTNEVGRAAALMGGLRHLAAEHRMPMRVREIGASGGLNLLADRFCYLDDRGGRHGPADSPVQLHDAWRGRGLPDAPVEVADRLGSDVNPVDVSTVDGRLTLLSYVWPDQTARCRRLRNAFAVAHEVHPPVVRQDARGFVDGIDLDDDSVTVLWHSVMWQYLTAADQMAVDERLESLGRQASTSRALAHLFLEPTRRSAGSAHEFLVVLRVWPGGDRRVLAAAAPHGLPTVWE
jgi:hypothetical protein